MCTKSMRTGSLGYTHVGVDRIRLSQVAFTNFIASAVEVYPKEAYGLLFGRKRRETIFCNASIPLQTARRGLNLVRPSIKEDLVKKVSCLMGLRWLGVYHSHPKGTATPSDLDLESWTDYPVEVILSLNQRHGVSSWKRNARQESRWRIDEDRFAIIGSLRKTRKTGYEIEIRGFYKPDTESRYRPLKMSCENTR